MPRGKRAPIERSDGKRYTNLTIAAHSIIAHDGCGSVEGVKSNISHSMSDKSIQKTAYGYEWRRMTECAGCEFVGIPSICPNHWSWPEYPATACRLKQEVDE